MQLVVVIPISGSKYISLALSPFIVALLVIGLPKIDDRNLGVAADLLNSLKMEEEDGWHEDGRGDTPRQDPSLSSIGNFGRCRALDL